MSAPGADVLFAPALELGRRLRAGELDAVDLTEAYLERIAQLDGTLHAFATVTPDLARAQARRAAEELQAGHVRGPLHGVPWGAKDLLATRSAPTTWGARPYALQKLPFDAEVVTRLEEAGAVLLGKLAMIELAGGLGYTLPGASATGAARNPWDTSRWTCGSSSGAGASVAAGLVGFAIGSETWGSILCPASFCGVSGFRPTFGRVSRRGAMALAWTFDKLGPLARTAADCEAVLAAIAGPDPLDSWSAAEPPSVPLASAAGLTAALIRPEGAEPEVAAAVEAAARTLRDAGLSVKEASLPDLPFEATAGVLVAAEAASAFDELFADGRLRQLTDPGAPLAPALARLMTGADYVKASRIRTRALHAMADFFGRFDVILAASEPMVAVSATESLADLNWSDPVGGMGNLCGLPAAAVPCGFGRGGLPVGLQVVAGAFEDARALAVARLYQSRTDWHTRRPPA